MVFLLQESVRKISPFIINLKLKSPYDEDFSLSYGLFFLAKITVASRYP